MNYINKDFDGSEFFLDNLDYDLNDEQDEDLGGFDFASNLKKKRSMDEIKALKEERKLQKELNLSGLDFDSCNDYTDYNDYTELMGDPYYN